MRRIIDHQRNENAILVYLYELMMDGIEHADLGRISRDSNISKPLTDIHLQSLEEKQLITSVEADIFNSSAAAAMLGASRTAYKISIYGIRQVESLSDNTYTDLLHSTGRTVSLEQPKDETWEPLNIDRATPEYADMLAKTRSAGDVIEGNNGYATSEPNERHSIVFFHKRCP